MCCPARRLTEFVWGPNLSGLFHKPLDKTNDESFVRERFVKSLASSSREMWKGMVGVG